MLLSVADTILTMHLLKCGLGYKCLPRICNFGGELSVYIVILIFFFLLTCFIDSFNNLSLQISITSEDEKAL